MATDNNNDETIFQPPVAQIFEDVDNEANGGKKPEADDRYEKLAQQLAELQRQMQETNMANMALMQVPARSQVTEQFVEINPETVKLPDPALDPDGYDAAVAKRTEIREQNRQRKQDFANRRQAEVKEKLDDLQSNFAERFPDMAEDTEKLDFIATKVVKAAQKRGIDVERYMFINQDRYINDVAKEYVKVFGDPSDTDADQEDRTSRQRGSSDTAPRSRSRSRDRSQNDDVGRTGGIFGGNESGGRPSGRNRDDMDGPSMIDDIQSIQKKTGFW